MTPEQQKLVDSKLYTRRPEPTPEEHTLGSETVLPEWWVWRTCDADKADPYIRWAGPFASKEVADTWIGRQNGWPDGMRSGRAVIRWDEPPAAPQSSETCRWYDSHGECQEPAAWSVRKPGRHTMLFCEKHASRYRREPYIVEPFPNAKGQPKVQKDLPCPNCYGGHFAPCHWCGDTGHVDFIPNAKGDDDTTTG